VDLRQAGSRECHDWAAPARRSRAGRAARRFRMRGRLHIKGGRIFAYRMGCASFRICRVARRRVLCGSNVQTQSGLSFDPGAAYFPDVPLSAAEARLCSYRSFRFFLRRYMASSAWRSSCFSSSPCCG
jgi:hypothetical protein